MRKIMDADANIVSKFLSSNSNNTQDMIAVLESVIKEYKAKENINRIPLNIFSKKNLGILEAIVKYLKETTNLSYHEIAQILNRDDRTIWATYNKACKKEKEAFKIENVEETIDPKIFSDRNQAPLKALITHLVGRDMTLKQISTALNRSYKTIWLTYRKKK
jgi:hypothetical protein